MPAKKVESMRQKEMNGEIIRLIRAKPIIDDKWLQIAGLKHDALKTYLVIKYVNIYDKYLPEWKEYNGETVCWWDADTHEEIKSKISGYQQLKESERVLKDARKIEKSKKLFCEASTQSFYYLTDSWKEAQDKYIEWCNNAVSEWCIGNMPRCGDD